MPTKIRLEPIAAIRIAASVEPITVPVPPRIETPPTTLAVMIDSTSVGGTVDWITPSWVAYSTEATPTKSPWIANVIRMVPRYGIPHSRAASELPPTA